MKQHIVRITEDALRDMEGIYYYIATQLQVPETAMAQYNRIADAIEGLETYPEIYNLMDTEPERSRGIRRIKEISQG